ncbi:O-antigen ligase family protein [Actinomadura miaoliensis]|uniref:O-antigen ligase family protein n=1 Tax=Actinomadura miaoliensis TaxID=430685 RepID=UPI0031EB1C3F
MIRTTMAAGPPRPGTLRADEPPGERPRGLPVVALVLVAGIASLPLLMPFGLPPGPGNTGLPDLVLVVLAVTTLLWAASLGVPVRWPFLVPTLLTVVAGGIAAVVNDVGPLTLVKDLFVLLWAVSLANLGRDPRLLRVALRAWVCAGVFSAVLMLAGFVTGQDALSGKQPDGERLQFTFGDANYAANWLICALFIARATRFPETAWRRWAVCAVLIAAELLTGSNGGVLALVLATVAGGLWRMVREGRAHHAVAAGCLVTLLGGGAVAALSQVDVQPYLDRASAASPVLRDSIGRSTGESAESRGTVTGTTLRMIREQPHPWGIGPAQTEARTLENQEAYVREAHNDYIAAVLERGFLGGIALIVLVFLLLLRCVRIARPGPRLAPEYARLVPRPELFGALVVVFLVSGLFYEVLHYRHGWAFFGLIAAVESFGRRPEATR